MTARAVISTIGRDRPGIVNEITEVVHGLGFSVEDSRMTVLGGEFAVLMSVTGENDALDALESQLADLSERTELAYLFRRTVRDVPVRHVLPYEVSVVAMDHPGIVNKIAAFFSSREINIRNLHTETQRAPHTGTPIFNLALTVEIPTAIKVKTLRDEFQDFCADNDLDGELIPAT